MSGFGGFQFPVLGFQFYSFWKLSTGHRKSTSPVDGSSNPSSGHCTPETGNGNLPGAKFLFFFKLTPLLKWFPVSGFRFCRFMKLGTGHWKPDTDLLLPGSNFRPEVGNFLFPVLSFASGKMARCDQRSLKGYTPVFFSLTPRLRWFRVFGFEFSLFFSLFSKMQ